VQSVLLGISKSCEANTFHTNSKSTVLQLHQCHLRFQNGLGKNLAGTSTHSQ